ncbi:hypothetical protein CMV_012440 [Castanea mollissima]|uniref:Protein kinase domain-containing protein n=1 Tax=Castanea mollissima TaxID=60419 RepID=A0A8J4R007_9ROSI|nr:hypothetical protein CMV_012440 [Castanea mollissima]
MYLKVSDFGIAKSFGGDQVEAKTNRIIGTYGCMSLEYAMQGRYSIKSDVFSFGVLILEIVSGKKNWKFCQPGHHLNLLGYAWRLWIEYRPTEMIDDLEVLQMKSLKQDAVRLLRRACRGPVDSKGKAFANETQ